MSTLYQVLLIILSGFNYSSEFMDSNPTLSPLLSAYQRQQISLPQETLLCSFAPLAATPSLDLLTHRM